MFIKDGAVQMVRASQPKLSPAGAELGDYDSPNPTLVGTAAAVNSRDV
jgi:hypothetical protein